jgi:hypothetical protein
MSQPPKLLSVEVCDCAVGWRNTLAIGSSESNRDDRVGAQGHGLLDFAC